MRPICGSALLLQLLIVALVYLAVSSSSVDGYLIGRLLRVQTPLLEKEQAYFPATRTAEQDSPPPAAALEDLGSVISGSYPSKKSQYTGYKSLKKFNSHGSRNCFFTPVQCMIEHDMSKYKKLVDSNIRIDGVSSK